MDFTLRCNSLKCRTQLSERAVVTTCSHIFCVPCSDGLGLSNSESGTRVCPACETQSNNPDDAVLTHLNPSEDYKTSVLSGSSPSSIIECAGRGISFFQYQTTQEIMYQDYTAKGLTDKYATSSTQMDNVINDANTEIMGLRDKLQGLHLEKKNLEQKNNESAEAFKEKSKAQHRSQNLYQKLKSQVNAAQMEYAAANDVENTINNVNMPHFINDSQDGTSQQRFATSQGRADEMSQIYSHQRIGTPGSHGRGMKAAFGWGGQPQGARPGLQSSQSVPISSTPSHRTRIPIAQPGSRVVPVFSGRDSSYGNTGNPGMHQTTPARQPLSSMDPNMVANSGYGMSAGMKMSRGPVHSARPGASGRPIGSFPLGMR